MSMDERFKSMHSAPIFKKIGREKHKIKLDDRFKPLLTDNKFRVKPGDVVDSYGRKSKKDSSAIKELKEFYEIEPEEKIVVAKTSFESKLDWLNKLSRGEIDGNSSTESNNSDNEVEEYLDNQQDNEVEDEDEATSTIGDEASVYQELRLGKCSC
jgi:hypothetical protein